MTDHEPIEPITPTILYAYTYSIANYIMPNSEKFSTPICFVHYFTSFAPRLPKHLDRYLNELFNHEKSIELNKRLWYCQQESEGVQS